MKINVTNSELLSLRIQTEFIDADENSIVSYVDGTVVHQGPTTLEDIITYHRQEMEKAIAGIPVGNYRVTRLSNAQLYMVTKEGDDKPLGGFFSIGDAIEALTL